MAKDPRPSGEVEGDKTNTFQQRAMDTQIVAVYCLCDDLLKALCQSEDAQRQMSDAEVMTTAIVAAPFFGDERLTGPPPSRTRI